MPPSLPVGAASPAGSIPHAAQGRERTQLRYFQSRAGPLDSLAFCGGFWIVLPRTSWASQRRKAKPIIIAVLSGSGFWAAATYCERVASLEFSRAYSNWGPTISLEAAKVHVNQGYAAFLPLRWERLIKAVTSRVRTSSGLMASPCLPACCNAET